MCVFACPTRVEAQAPEPWPCTTDDTGRRGDSCAPCRRPYRLRPGLIAAVGTRRSSRAFDPGEARELPVRAGIAHLHTKEYGHSNTMEAVTLEIDTFELQTSTSSPTVATSMGQHPIDEEQRDHQRMHDQQQSMPQHSSQHDHQQNDDPQQLSSGHVRRRRIARGTSVARVLARWTSLFAAAFVVRGYGRLIDFQWLRSGCD